MRNKIFLLTTLLLIYAFFGTKREPNTNEYAYTWAAVASKSIEPCKKIGAASIKTYAFNPVKHRATSLRSECYRLVALATGNKELCKYAVPVSRLRSMLWSGSGNNTEQCRTQVKKKQFSLGHNLTPVLATRLMSNSYSKDAIYQDCNNQFTTQIESSAILKNNYHKKYNQCVTRRQKPTSRILPFHSLESGRTNNPPYYSKAIEPSFKTREQCKDTLIRTIVKEHYFGKTVGTYPRDRQYSHCENYCAVIELEGYCKKPDGEIPFMVYKQFLSSQARNGKLIERLNKMPNYYFW